MTRRSFVFTPLIALAFAVLCEAEPVREPAPISRAAVQSTSLASVGYDSAGKILEVEFLTGAVYRYMGVPEKVYRDLLAADSKGKYFSKNIRGHYVFVKVPAKTP